MAFQVDNNVVGLDDNSFDYLFEDEDYDHTLYMVFRKVKYPTIADVAKMVGSTIRRFHNVKKISVSCKQSDKDSGICDIIELTCDDVSKVIVTIPPREEILSPIREEFYISVIDRNKRSHGRTIVRSLGDIEIEIRNSLICF